MLEMGQGCLVGRVGGRHWLQAASPEEARGRLVLVGEVVERWRPGRVVVGVHRVFVCVWLVKREMNKYINYR